MSQSAKTPDPQAVLQFARRGRARAAGDDTGNQVAAVLAKAGFSDPTLVLRWRDIVGADVARITQPLKLVSGAEGDVLTLKCEAGAAVFLQHETRALLERINRYLGVSRVVRLKLVGGSIVAPAQPPEHPQRRRTREAEDPPQPDAKPTLSNALSRLARRRGATPSKRPD